MAEACRSAAERTTNAADASKMTTALHIRGALLMRAILWLAFFHKICDPECRRKYFCSKDSANFWNRVVTSLLNNWQNLLTASLLNGWENVLLNWELFRPKCSRVKIA
eukprot:gnl/MRDRNA2_/MRDRNA2_148709_c0_seq1.p1 gnl/MRDRNA2_/MRDRNA2_148709_c0~~gnl/MRDRNA2_/MRDRNA2_148709_c0_seq1.p1  ORF type:complete len:108 (+),score=12.13 gnl/MRDRNA2_/MRDRNA2_148709_c0_seq1:158-481(+)